MMILKPPLNEDEKLLVEFYRRKKNLDKAWKGSYQHAEENKDFSKMSDMMKSSNDADQALLNFIFK